MYLCVKNENDTENVTEIFSTAIQKHLDQYGEKKRSKAEALLIAISSDEHITIEKMVQVIGVTDRTVKRYLKEFQDAGALRLMYSLSSLYSAISSRLQFNILNNWLSVKVFTFPFLRSLSSWPVLILYSLMSLY